jgi:hypothetical protein
MRNSHRRSWLLSGLSALALACFVHGQNPPQPLPLEIIGKAQLTEQDKKRVEEYCKHYTDLLNAETSTPADVERAREELLKPLDQPNPARVIGGGFRGEYSGRVIPALDNTVARRHSPRHQRGSRSLATGNRSRGQHAAAECRCTESGALAGETQRRHRRESAAAVGNSRCAEGAGERAQASGEVVRHHFRALDVADSATLQPGDRTPIRLLRGEAVDLVINRIVAMTEPSAPMIDAVGGAIATLRTQFLQFNKETEQRPIGEQLGPALGQLLQYIREHWDALRTDKALNGTMNVVVLSSEGFLQTIDQLLASGRPSPGSDMGSAWKTNDKPKFEAGVEAWEGVLSKPPYKQ